jgi:hypothetical protein
MSTNKSGSIGLARTIDSVVRQSIDSYYNPYKKFQWVESMPEARWWLSRDLMTVRGTHYEDEFSEQQLMTLSKWESINFYSLNIHGIRELIMEVAKRIYSPGFELASKFFHLFIDEENGHMWFFAEFCQRYGSKIYEDKRIKLKPEFIEPDIETFQLFARILIFEEIVDFFNLHIGRDVTLHPLIRQINNVHHDDESRHIIFGRQIVKQLHEEIRARHSPEQLTILETYLKRFMIMSLESLYNPAVYRDAGIFEPYKIRTELLKDPARRPYHMQFLNRTIQFFMKEKIITQEVLSS